MSAAGKVCTGFSKPYVALYSANGSTVTYSNPMLLARGVNMTLNVQASDDNTFYADNVSAESESGKFSSGTVDLTVDGLLAEAEKLIAGLPTAEELTVGSSTVDVQSYGDDANPPYLGLGVIVRYQSDGEITYAPVVLTKIKFNPSGLEAATQEETVSWQTQSLSAKIHRDDSTKHNWKKVAEDQTTEEAAENVLKAMLGGATV